MTRFLQQQWLNVGIGPLRTLRGRSTEQTDFCHFEGGKRPQFFYIGKIKGAEGFRCLALRYAIPSEGNKLKPDGSCFFPEFPDAGGVEIRLQSRQEAMFGSTIRSCAESCLEELGVENALVEIQDYGCLDFAIRARLKTAVRRARRSEHG